MGNKIGTALDACCNDNKSTTQKVSIVSIFTAINKPSEKNNDKISSLQEEAKLTVNQQIEDYVNIKPKSKKKITFDDFKLEGILGEGGFGVVFLAQLKENIQKNVTEKYALKKVTKSVLIEKKLLENAKLQKNILATFECKFIVALLMAFQDANFVYFAMQCATGGDTYSLISKKTAKVSQFKALGEVAIKFIAACVILGLEYLHNNKIIYRDLKPENVLMFENGYVKITDFGLAKKTEYDQVNSTVTGTVFYYAPEMVLRKGYNMGIDFWTLGVYLYELSVMEPPFQKRQIDKYRFKKACLDGEANRNWKGAVVSDELKSLINGLLKLSPEERLGFKGWQEVKNHEFFDGFDWESLGSQTMESPLKQLINSHPVKIKEYKHEAPKEDPIKVHTIQGWSMIKNGQKVI